MVSSATSLDYLLDNNICDLTDCSATTTTMSFEFQFGLSADEFEALRNSISDDGIEFHLSPERGLLPQMVVPTPATLPVMFFGILLLIAASRCRKQATWLRT